MAVLSLPDFSPDLRARFAADCYVPLPQLVCPDGLSALRTEVRRLEKLAVRRDFSMASMGHSPRHMTTLGGHLIAEESKLIAGVYRDGQLIRLVGAIAGWEAVGVRDPLERHVINILHQRGDTHGAHTDDYPVALVLFMEAPDDPADGGLLEHVPHATGLEALTTGAARVAHHRPGDGYLLRSDVSAHRVTPLRRSGLRRTVLNFAYTTQDRQAAITPSASELY
ncbi:hypothetical protein [Streptomyces sp. NPDC017993]|uniref:HalD/BesD family halogenase n=1 Tax=Streptomyces sp. NPDC017993 TaxID=3365027 RepID=UPI00378FB141